MGEVGAEGVGVFEAAKVEEERAVGDAADHRHWQGAEAGGQRVGARAAEGEAGAGDLLERERAARADAETQRERLYAVFEQAPAAIAILRGPEFVYELSNPLNQAMAHGRALVARAQRDVWPVLEASVAQVCASLQGPLLQQLAALEAGLHRTSLLERSAASIATQQAQQKSRPTSPRKEKAR